MNVLTGKFPSEMCLIIFPALTFGTGMKPTLYRYTFRRHINLACCCVVPLTPMCLYTKWPLKWEIVQRVGGQQVYYLEALRGGKAHALDC